MSALHDAGGALAGLLDSIDDGKLRQVIRLVEASGQRCTLEPALATLRPRLRQLRPRRPLTLSRLLTLPFASALDHTPGGQWPYSIARERLGDWQKRMVERLDPPTITATRALIAGHAAEDEAAILEAGRRCWPAAAAVLAAEAVPGETEVIEVERHRIADLLAIADQLVPLLGRLPPVAPGDEDDRATVDALLALAEAGPPDRLGVLAALLLRQASQPAALVQWLRDLAPAALRPRLHSILQRLSAEHRADLARRVADLGAAPELPLEVAVDELSRLADALMAPTVATPGKPLGRSPERAVQEGELTRLRHTTAALARERYAETIDSILVRLPAAEAANHAAAVRAREESARRLTRLGSTVRRLATDVSIHQVMEAAIERLVDLEARRRGGGRALVTVDDARLIEILAGPDLAWRYLRPEAGR